MLTVVLLATAAVASDPSDNAETPYSAEVAEPTQGVSEKSVQATRPAYPRVTPSIWYEVDPDWPRRPKDISWGGTPGVAVDNQDQVWVFTRAEPPVQVYSADGEFLRSWGEGLIGRRGSSVGSHGIKIDHQGMIWLADCINHVILQVTPEGKLLKTIGTPGEAGCDESHLNMPTDMAITPQGDVFVADGYGNARIVHFDAKGQFVKAWGSLGVEPGEFNVPHAIVLDSEGALYVADRNNARVQVFDQNGKFLNQWRNLIIPWGLWTTVDNEIWVCGCSPMPWRETDGDYLSCPPKDQILMRFSPRGNALQLWTVPKGKDNEEKPGELNWVHGIAVDSKGNLYVADIMGKRVQKLVRQN